MILMAIIIWIKPLTTDAIIQEATGLTSGVKQTLINAMIVPAPIRIV
jgi:hypothetical protein